MQRLTLKLTLAVLLLATLACSSLTKPAGGSGSLGSVRELWEDVPRMDGLNAVDEDLPLFAQVLLRTFVRNLTGDGESAGNWIVFSTDKTSEDVQAYYTEERLGETGWAGSGRDTCTTGSTQGMEQLGVLCLYQKQEGGNFNALMIMTAENTNAGGNYVVFVRIEAEATPEPTP